MILSDRLIKDLNAAFGYTGDNNRDLIGDTTFTLGEVVEELKVEEAYQFLCAYIVRNEAMINSNLQED